MFERFKKSANTDAYGPWTETETRAFVTSVVGAHKDSVNDRFDFASVAAELQGRTFDAAELWETLESYRLQKWDAGVYSL